MELTPEELKRDNANMKRQLEVALQKIDMYENEDLEKEGYYAYKGLVQQQIEVVKDFKLKDEITKNPKDDKYYDRVKAIGEGLKSMLTDLKVLKIDLKINPKEEKEWDLKRKQRTSPESIADVLTDSTRKID